MDTQNVTLSLPKSVARKLRILAATHNKSMTKVVTELVNQVPAGDDEYEKAHKRMLARMKSAPIKTWDGKVTWTRDELHER